MKNTLPLILLLLLIACKQSTNPESENDQSNGDNPQTENSEQDLNQDEVDIDTVALKRVSLADSNILVPAMEAESPVHRHRVDVLLANSEDDAFNRLVNDNIYGNDNPAEDGDYEAYYRRIVGEVQDASIDESDMEFVEESPHGFNMEFDESSEALLNRDGYLTMSYHYYKYTGGAHGNFFTSYFNFSRDPAKRLQFADIFGESATEEAIVELLKTEIEPETLEYLEGELPITQNFALTDEGVNFLYNIYEILPYAAGMTEVLLPFGLLQEKGLLSDEVNEMVGD
ncbi:MAG: DUF3298 domain-containing protein [Bacteroidota bacterium]